MPINLCKAYPYRSVIGNRQTRQYSTLLQVFAVQDLIVVQMDLACFECAHTRPACGYDMNAVVPAENSI
jgi:hypothetical protein